MTSHAPKTPVRLYLNTLMATAALALGQTAVATAQETSPFTTLPDTLVGLTQGTLQPENTFKPYVGSTQTTRASSDGQTGRQVYYGGFRYRGTGSWQAGASLSLFDDSPAAAINGRADTLTYVGLGVDLKYQFYNDGRLSASVLGGVEGAYFSRGGGLTTQSSVPEADKDSFVAATLSIPVTYRIAAPLWITGELGYTHAASTIAGQRGLGGRSFASIGLTYQATNRLFYYGALKALSRQIENGIDAQDQSGRDYIYTFGAQYALTPQSAINLYVTNAFSPTATGDDLLFFPDKSEPVFGLMLSYVPSGKGTGDSARTFRSPNRPANEPSRFADGFTIKGPHTLASDRIHTRLSYGSAGQSELAVFYAPDPDFQLEFSIEDFALESGANFRSEAEEDRRYMIGGRWQAMDEAYGQPFNLGFGIAASRDIKKPTIGSVFVEASASKRYSRSEIVLNARSAIYSSETLAGAGLLFSYDVNTTTTAIAEYTALHNDKPVWAMGLRHAPRNMPFSVDLYATNAAGLNGIGSLLSNEDPQFGISLHWEGGLDLF